MTKPTIVAVDDDPGCWPPFGVTSGLATGTTTGSMDGTGTLRLTTRQERDVVLVEIGDSGTWADASAKDRAFESFFTTKGVGQGTGLGLDISRRIIVGRHRGDTAVDLRAGETVLRVWLPRQHETVPP